jgi:hypothetical protein
VKRWRGETWFWAYSAVYRMFPGGFGAEIRCFIAYVVCWKLCSIYPSKNIKAKSIELGLAMNRE